MNQSFTAALAANCVAVSNQPLNALVSGANNTPHMWYANLLTSELYYVNTETGIIENTIGNASDFKESCRLATTAPINLATIALGLIDGIAPLAGERILVKDQAAPAQNGIYIASLTAWQRSADADTSAEVTSGMTTFVTEGNTQAGTFWSLITPDPIFLDVTALTFALFNPATYVGGPGITIVGNIISALQGTQAILNLPDAPAIVTPAQLQNGIISMSANTVARTITTDTAAAITAFFVATPAGFNFAVTILNQGNFNVTLAGGVGVTIVGNAVVPAKSAFTYLFVSAGGGFNAYNVTSINPLAEHVSVVTPLADAAAPILITEMINGIFTQAPSVPRAVTTPIAAVIIAGMTNKTVGASFEFSLVNTGVSTATMTAGDADVTFVGAVIVLGGASAKFMAVIDTATKVKLYRTA